MKRESITLTIAEVNPFTIGALIALFERAVGFYASFLGVNAYHQPGVEAGKQAAEQIINLERAILDFLKGTSSQLFSAPEIAHSIGSIGREDLIFRICEHLATNGRVRSTNANSPTQGVFGA
jgi:glucose-6-phosphate isomerase